MASYRVIADHLRSMSFLIADGVLPANEGRGYVLRRIMRRAMRHATLLGTNNATIFKLVPSLVREMGQAYPDLVAGEAMISETIRLEEERFLKTLSRGLQILEDESAGLDRGDTLAGETAFKLYDTYGFPAGCFGRPDRVRCGHGAPESRSTQELVGIGRCGNERGVVFDCRHGRAHRISGL